MKKTILILVMMLIFSLIASGCMPKVELTPTTAPTAKLEPTPIPPRATTKSIEVVSEGERYYETEGGFSYIIPDGWQVTEFPGLKFKAVFSETPVGGISANTIFVDEVFSGDLGEYFESSIAMLNETFSELEIQKTGNDETANGLSYYWLVSKNIFNEVEMRQTYFVFNLGERKLVVTYTSGLQDSEENIFAIGDLINSLLIED